MKSFGKFTFTSALPFIFSYFLFFSLSIFPYPLQVNSADLHLKEFPENTLRGWNTSRIFLKLIIKFFSFLFFYYMPYPGARFETKRAAFKRVGVDRRVFNGAVMNVRLSTECSLRRRVKGIRYEKNDNRIDNRN